MSNRNKGLVLLVILILGFSLASRAEDKQPKCFGKHKDMLVPIKEIYPWILTTVREQEAQQINRYREPAELKPENDPNLLGGMP